MTMNNHVTELIAGYALNSIDPEERLLVEGHIRECEICKADLRAYREVMGEIAYAVSPVEPPLDLKQKIMGRVITQDQSVHKERGLSLWEKLLNYSRSLSPTWAIASVLLVVILGAGNLYMLDQINDLKQAQADTSLAVVNLSGTEITPDASGLIVVSMDGEHGTLIVDRLPILDDTRQYQLWLILDGERTSGGVFSVSNDGYGSLWVKSTEPLSSFNSFGITIEPYGGSPKPTGEKVLGSDV